MLRLIRSYLACVLASASLAGCASGTLQTPAPNSALVPQSGPKGSVGIAARSTTSQGKSNTQVLNAGGGTIRAVTFGGFQGTFAYAANNAAPNVEITMTNNGPNNAFNAPTPQGATPVLYLAAAVGGSQPVAFQSASLAASLSSATALPAATSYTVYFYEGNSQLGSALAFVGPKKQLKFQSPLAGLSITPGSPLVLELVPTSAAAPGTLFVSDVGNTDSVAIYAPPFSGSSQGFTTRITAGVQDPQALALDSSGNLYVTNYGRPGQSPPIPSSITVYAPPFTSASQPALTISSGIRASLGITIDANGRLFENDAYGYVDIYEPPFVGASQGLTTRIPNIYDLHGLFIGQSNNLYVPQFGGGNDSVAIFEPPFTNSSRPSSYITNGVFTPSDAVVDASGNLYASQYDYGQIRIYTPPFTGSTQGLSNTITNGVLGPTAMTLDSAGDLYVDNISNVTIYAPPFLGSSQGLTTTIGYGLTYPTGVAVQAGIASGQHRSRASSTRGFGGPSAPRGR